MTLRAPILTELQLTFIKYFVKYLAEKLELNLWIF